MKLRILTLTALLALVTTTLTGQVVLPHQYRLTRSLPAPAATFTFLRSALVCGLARLALPTSVGLRIEDPNNIALDCELLGTAGGVIIPRIAGTTYAYSIAASNADGVEWTVEVPALNVNMPLPPALPRVRPGVQVATAEGVVGERFPFAGMDIVPVILDNIGVVVHFGAPTLTVPGPGGYDVQAGDRFAFAFWKDVQ